MAAPPKLYAIKREAGEYGQINFQTLSFPFFDELYDLFYVDGVKRVPATIGERLTPIGLAYWAMEWRRLASHSRAVRALRRPEGSSSRGEQGSIIHAIGFINYFEILFEAVRNDPADITRKTETISAYTVKGLHRYPAVTL